MKLGIILQSNKPQHVWNSFRFGITSLKAGHAVEAFLMCEGPDLDAITDRTDFDISLNQKYYEKTYFWEGLLVAIALGATRRATLFFKESAHLGKLAKL